MSMSSARRRERDQNGRDRARRAHIRAQNRARVARHRARDKDGIGIIPVEFEALAIFLDHVVPRVGHPFNADDRKDLGTGFKGLGRSFEVDGLC